MRKLFLVLGLLAASAITWAAPPAAPAGWKAKVTQNLPLLGHRNWILIVDSAYPLQSSPGVETIETNADQVDVIRYVLGAIGGSIHVRPLLSMDAELPFVAEEDAPGISAYRARIAALLHGVPIESLPHDKLIATIGDAGSQFHVLVLKTKMTLPYTSVFIRLDCKYWSADAERRMRGRMAAAEASSAH